MSDLEALSDKLKHISAEIQKAPRVDPDDPSKTGWGQFVDAPAHITQIGPYGTSAALLVQSLSHNHAPVHESVVDQLNGFWSDSRKSNKLFTQNVRAAFLVLALAKVSDGRLVDLRTKVLDELCSRQMSDGGWPDAVIEGIVHPLSRAEPTAWVILAINRVKPSDKRALDGARYIQSQITGLPNSALVSPIAAAAALSILPREEQTLKLKRRAMEVLRNHEFSQEEYISFFDYAEEKNGAIRMSRDYLCFPAFYPVSLLVSGLMKTRNPFSLLKFAMYRSRLIENLLKLIPDNSLYRLPGAQFSATVDQSLIALSYEELIKTQSFLDPFTRIIRPLTAWFSNSIWTQVLLPLVFLGGAIATLADPLTVPALIDKIPGIDAGYLVNLAKNNADVIRVAVATLLALVPSMPVSTFSFIRKKLSL